MQKYNVTETREITLVQTRQLSGTMHLLQIAWNKI